MPDAIITSTESTFGTISGTFLETGATIQGTITGVVAGTLDGSVGVPGPAGSPGATGPQGPQGIQGVPGAPGVGVPAGGTAGQILAKVDGTNYNTQWVNDSGAVVWGNITGTLSNQTDLQTALNAKLDIEDAESSFYPLTGNPSGFLTSSALSGYATESWVTAGFYPLASNPAGYLTSASLSGYAPLASPAFTGNPTAPTAALADNDTSIATTAFVQQELASGTAVAKNLEVYVRNQTGATLTAGTIVYINGATGNRPTITKAQANNDANSAQTFGFVKASIANNGFGYVIVRGELENVDTSALTEGVQLYLSPTVAGTWTTTKPSAPQHLVYVGICVRAHPTQGTILVAVQNGYELNELHDVQIVSPTNGQVLKYDSATGLWKNATDSAGVAWGGITGTLSSQTDLQTALDGKYSTSNPAGYITSSALSPYLTSATATATYLAKASNLSDVGNVGTARTNLGLGTSDSVVFGGLSIANVITGYNFSGTFSQSTLHSLKINNAAGITFSDNSAQTVAYPGPSGFLLKSGNLSGLADVATARTNLGLGTAAVESANRLVPAGGTTGQVLAKSSSTDYADEWITIPSAPVTSVAGRTGAVTLSTSDISGLGTMATATAADYSTTAVANGLYYPLSGNPSGFLTSASLSGYATESFVTSQGYITSSALTPYLTSATAASTYLTQSNAATTYYPLSSNPAGYLTSAPVTSVAGKTGAVSLVVGDVSGAAPLASPALTGTPTAPTATAGTNTTQIATTAFVLANAGSTSFATAADAVLQSSTTTALSPSVAPFAISNGLTTRLDYITTTGVSGSGAVTASLVGFREMYTNSTGTNGKATFTAGQIGLVSVFHNLTSEAQTNFSKKIWMSGRFLAYLNSTYVGDADGFVSISLGGYSTTTATGAMTVKGIGLRKVGGASSVIQLVVHNGTTQTLVNTTKTMGMMEVVEYLVYSDGAGNVQLYLNGSLAASSSAGPTGNTANFQNIYREQAEQTSSATSRHLLHCYGGQLITER